MPDPCLITHDIATEAFLDAFRHYVGRGAGKISIADLAAGIDVQARTVKARRDGDTTPYWSHLLRLMAYFGPRPSPRRFSPPAGLGPVERTRLVEAAAQETATGLVAAASDLLERLRDRWFRRIDRAETGPKLLALATRIEARAKAMIGAAP